MVEYNILTDKTKPYTYKGHIRCFCKHLTSKDLVWHRDKGDRFIRVLSGENWYLQLDNKIPILLLKNKIYKIKSAIYHRLINLNETDLKIIIFKNINKIKRRKKWVNLEIG